MAAKSTTLHIYEVRLMYNIVSVYKPEKDIDLRVSMVKNSLDFTLSNFTTFCLTLKYTLGNQNQGT